jgi:hypothetical protein
MICTGSVNDPTSHLCDEGLESNAADRSCERVMPDWEKRKIKLERQLA